MPIVIHSKLWMEEVTHFWRDVGYLLAFQSLISSHSAPCLPPAFPKSLFLWCLLSLYVPLLRSSLTHRAYFFDFSLSSLLVYSLIRNFGIIIIIILLLWCLDYNSILEATIWSRSPPKSDFTNWFLQLGIIWFMSL